MKVIPLDEAEKALAEQMAYEARMEYGGRHKAEDYLLIAKAYFQNCPIIEAEPVRHGRWLTRDVRYVENRPVLVIRCSECGTYTAVKSNYCPTCGTLMEEPE